MTDFSKYLDRIGITLEEIRTEIVDLYRQKQTQFREDLDDLKFPVDQFSREANLEADARVFLQESNKWTPSEFGPWLVGLSGKNTGSSVLRKLAEEFHCDERKGTSPSQDGETDNKARDEKVKPVSIPPKQKIVRVFNKIPEPDIDQFEKCCLFPSNPCLVKIPAIEMCAEVTLANDISSSRLALLSRLYELRDKSAALLLIANKKKRVEAEERQKIQKLILSLNSTIEAFRRDETILKKTMSNLEGYQRNSGVSIHTSTRANLDKQKRNRLFNTLREFNEGFRDSTLWKFGYDEDSSAFGTQVLEIEDVTDYFVEQVSDVLIESVEFSQQALSRHLSKDALHIPTGLRKAIDELPSNIGHVPSNWDIGGRAI